VTSGTAAAIRDGWLIPILRELLGETSMESVEKQMGSSWWETAVAAGLASDDDILHAVAVRTRLSTATDLIVSSEARDKVGERLARRYGILPLSISETILNIATSNPFDLDCEKTLAFATRTAVRMSLASPVRIAERIEEVYAPVERVSRILDRAGSSSAQPVLEKTDDADRGIEEKGAGRPIIKLVDHIVAEGIAGGASDIHLEAGEHGMSVRYRIDGILREVMVLPRAVAIPLVSRIKIMSQMDIADRLRPQGGRARVAINGSRVDLRVSTLPASHGEKVVIRILDARGGLRSVESLGLDPVDGPRMQQLLEAREGLVLVTGPTGSGKTTTLYAALKLLQQRGLNIITVEDPVEYRIPGIVQVQIHEKAGLTFASALRSVLRQDPDVVLIGEIRDRETAAIALQASLTGHLVFATLHTNDASSSIVRLTDLGVDCVKLAGALRGVVAQRLIRRLCQSCKQVANAGVPRSLLGSIPESSMIYMPVGCPECALTGYRGRMAVTEVLVATPELERAIACAEAPDNLVAAARAAGTRSLWGSGAAHLLNGTTSAQELLRVLEPEHTRGTAHEPRRGYDLQRPITYESSLPSRKTKIVAGVVEVYVIRRNGGDWRVLALQRASDTKRPDSWESVYGKIDDDERPERAAVREVREETGLEIEALYNLTVSSFYLHEKRTVQMAIAFVAFVNDESEVTLSEEHQKHEWLSVEDAGRRFTWPRATHALADAKHLFAKGSAGPVEDVLRVV
jgi:type II secretory ATPase GspE/PulE/Tfp pilus assembly ATPase PilB-like protein/8-oxo-dGTP pyrophosphatase MutT (NUDIX family)